MQLYAVGSEFDSSDRTSLLISVIIATPFADFRFRKRLFTSFVDAVSAPRTPTRKSGTDEVCNRVVLHLSIITACIPSMRPLFKNLQSGVMDATLRSDPANPSTTNTWVLRTQSSSGWKSSTIRARMESYTQRSDGESGA